MAVRLGVEPRTSRYTLQHVSWVSHNNNTYPWSSPKNHVITAECSNQLSYQTNRVRVPKNPKGNKILLSRI